MFEKIEEFLRELSELSQKYNLYIGGCGCCDSPYIQDAEGKFYEAGYNERLKWDKDQNKYVIKW